MGDSDEIYHVEEPELQELWDLVHADHQGIARFCDHPACKAINKMFGRSTVCGGEGNDDD